MKVVPQFCCNKEEHNRHKIGCNDSKHIAGNTHIKRTEEQEIKEQGCCGCNNTVNCKNPNLSAASYKLLAKLAHTRNQHEKIQYGSIIAERHIVDFYQGHRIVKNQKCQKTFKRCSHTDGENIAFVFVLVKSKAKCRTVYLQEHYRNEDICGLLNQIGSRIILRHKFACDIRHKQKGQNL